MHRPCYGRWPRSFGRLACSHRAGPLQEQFEATPTAARPAPRCVVVRQDFSLAETISGGGGSSRVSFGAFNKAIDAENGVVPPAAEGTKEEAARTGGGADVSEAEMAAALNECRDVSGVAGGGRRKDGGAAAASPHGTPQKKVKRGKKKREHRGEGGGEVAAAGPPVAAAGAGKAKRKREPGDAGPPAAPGKVRKSAGGGTHGAASHGASGGTPGAGVQGASGAKAGPGKSLREQAAAAHKARRQKRQARAAKKDAG